MSKIRQYFYLVSGVIAGLLPVLLFFHAITSDQAVTVTELVKNLASLLGGGAAATAGVILSKQRKDPTIAIGTSAADVVVANLPKVADQVRQAQDDMAKVRDAVSNAINDVPVLGPLAAQMINSIPS